MTQIKKLALQRQNQSFPSKFSIIIILSGAIMIGHGVRMIYQGLFHPQSYYSPNLFDILFDWTTLLILGVILFYFGLKTYFLRQQSLSQKIN